MKLKLDANNRIKKRYLLIDGKKDEVEKAILDYLGILGYAQAAPMFVDDNKHTVLAINRKEIDKVKASIELYGKMKILKISGTLKGLGK